MGSDWLLGGDRETAAAERIYANAARLMAREGSRGLNLDALAREANCSRATLYRHVGGKSEIREAVLTRSARRIVESIQEAVAGLTGTERIVKAIAVAVAGIRADPVANRMVQRNAATSAMFTDSPALARFAAACSGLSPDNREGGLWIIRVVLALVCWPGADGKTEEQLLRRFVAPAFEETALVGN